jgi:hypothetical protein
MRHVLIPLRNSSLTNKVITSKSQSTGVRQTHRDREDREKRKSQTILHFFSHIQMYLAHKNSKDHKLNKQQEFWEDLDRGKGNRGL